MQSIDAALVCLCIMVSGCASYHIIPLERFKVPAATPDASESIVTTYAVTKNNMIIPELVIDRRGRYPTDRAVARQRYKDRRAVLKTFVEQKYITENSTIYQLKHIPLIAGQLIISPFVMMAMALGDLFHHRTTTAPDETMLKSYLRSIFTDPVPQKPVLRDELAYRTYIPE